MKELMNGKRGLIMGVANDHSLAWGIAQSLSAQGAELAFSYQSEAFKKRVQPLIESIGHSTLIECDVESEESIIKLFESLNWPNIDFVVHAIGYSDREELKGSYVNTSKDNFLKTMSISCYSLTSVCRTAQKYMSNGGNIITLTYIGSERVMPHYNVMGVAKAALEASVKYLAVDLGNNNIRINAISAGPVRTLASAGIGDFKYILKWNQYNSPLKRNTSLNDVGNSALFLLSDLSSGITGEVIHVDSGYHIVGMKAIDAPDITVTKN